MFWSDWKEISIMPLNKPFAIGIAGATQSGKSTYANELASALKDCYLSQKPRTKPPKRQHKKQESTQEKKGAKRQRMC